MPDLKELLWRSMFASWPHLDNFRDGYSLLVPVPADLPAFLPLALANAAAQDCEGRVETLVIPDVPSVSFKRAYFEAIARVDIGPSRLIELTPAARALQRFGRNKVSNNHFLQIYAGVAAATTSHILLHDADLFIEDTGFMARHYRRCVEEDLACLGVSYREDATGTWLRDNGFGHVLATWELMLSARWLRLFKPWQHRSHVESVNGHKHLFDITHYTQALTPPERCGLHDATSSFEHFNYLFGTYREFERAAAASFLDDGFRLLLIRLLSDAFEAPAGNVPTVAELALGIENDTAPVVYGPDATRCYREFRCMLDRVLSGGLFGPNSRRSIHVALTPFDRAFG